MKTHPQSSSRIFGFDLERSPQRKSCGYQIGMEEKTTAGGEKGGEKHLPFIPVVIISKNFQVIYQACQI